MNKLYKMIKGLERHTYAPELNKIHLKSGVRIPAGGITSIAQYTARFKQPTKFIKLVTVLVSYPDRDDIQLRGSIKGYKELVAFMDLQQTKYKLGQVKVTSINSIHGSI